MREIKFRAWEKAYKKMVSAENYNHYFSYAESPDLSFWFENEDIEAMQYTGLKDKHGKEIFVDDFVRDEFGDIHRVYFDCGSFLVKPGSDDIATLFGLSTEDCEIIGNVWENPELLPKENK